MKLWRQFWLLFRLFFRTQLGLSVARDAARRDKKALFKFAGIGLAVAVGVLSILLTYGVILFSLMWPASQIGIGAAVLALIFFLCMGLVLILGTVTMITMVFGARDAELYAALPLSQRAVFLAKLGMAYLLELLPTLFLGLPAVILYAVYTPVAWWYWIAAALVLPLLPVIPMALSALLAALLMRLAARFKRREVFMVVGGLAIAVGAVLLQGQFNAFFSSVFADEAAVSAMLQDSAEALRAMTAVFPPVGWAAGALTAEGLSWLGQLCLFLLSAAAAGGLALWLGGRVFYRGALAQLETAPGRSKGYNRASLGASSPLKALYVREWRMLLRTGVYALNALTGIVIFPVMLVFMPMMGGASGDMSELLPLLEGWAGPLLPLVAAGLMLLPALINPAATTALSREGRQFWLCRSIPVPMRTQALAKLLCSWSIALAGVGLIFGAALLALPIPAADLLCGLPVAAALSFPVTALSMLPDLLKPKLTWNSESEAIKQNINSLTGMLLALAAVLLAAGIALPLALFLALPDPLTALVLTVLFAGAGYGGWRLVRALADGPLEAREE
ncbi:MAG: hypothetical protein LBT60_05600 [Oscillospiraceae bacterium]|jgi:ABC-2 type transport system permease protein|nr:hypothetical protein [Oscillospiraceae bacterium]